MVSPPEGEAPAPGAGRGRLWQGLLGVAISIGFLVWALWDVNLADVARQIRAAHPGWLTLSAVLVTCTFPLRAIRWRILLHSSAGDLPYQPVWHATAIGFMANNVVPGRAGELIRCLAATRLIGIPFTTALATVAVERVFDGVIIVLLLSLSLAGSGLAPDTALFGVGMQTLALTMAAVFSVALAVLIVLARTRQRSVPWISGLVRRLLPQKPAAFVVRVFENVVVGLGVLQSTRDVARVIVWSLVVWGTNALSYVVAFRAFALDVPPVASGVLQGAVAFGASIPQAPGFFGTFEALSKLVLGLFGVPDDRGVSFAIGVHMCWFVPITVIGLVILARTGLSLHALRGEGAAPAEGTA